MVGTLRFAHPTTCCNQRPLVGILLNGTSLSTLMSPGRPSTRSAMMLRRISSVPPAMRIDGEGALVLAGVFKTDDMQVKYRIRYVQNNKLWKLLGINVDATRK